MDTTMERQAPLEPIADTRAHPIKAWSCDPLAKDTPADDVVVTTRRRLMRLMVTSVDVGARFERERVAHDAGAWMIAPRRMFGGRPAIEAAQELGGCLRATVLHGLSLGLDADPRDLDDLLADDHGPRTAAEEGGATPNRAWDGPRLLSAWIDMTASATPAMHFCAMVTDDPARFAVKLVERFGPDGAGAAEIEMGFDPTSARATAFIGEALSQTLSLAAVAPDSLYAKGLDVVVEQRFSA